MNDVLGLKSNDEAADVVNPFIDENNLKIVANVILVVGIICSFIIFFALANVTIPASEYNSSQYIFNWSGFVMSLSILFSSIGMSYFFKVISNISISLKTTNQSRRDAVD